MPKSDQIIHHLETISGIRGVEIEELRALIESQKKFASMIYEVSSFDSLPDWLINGTKRDAALYALIKAYSECDRAKQRSFLAAVKDSKGLDGYGIATAIEMGGKEILGSDDGIKSLQRKRVIGMSAPEFGAGETLGYPVLAGFVGWALGVFACFAAEMAFPNSFFADLILGRNIYNRPEAAARNPILFGIGVAVLGGVVMTLSTVVSKLAEKKNAKIIACQEGLGVLDTNTIAKLPWDKSPELYQNFMRNYEKILEVQTMADERAGTNVSTLAKNQQTLAKLEKQLGEHQTALEFIRTLLPTDNTDITLNGELGNLDASQIRSQLTCNEITKTAVLAPGRIHEAANDLRSRLHAGDGLAKGRAADQSGKNVDQLKM